MNNITIFIVAAAVILGGWWLLKDTAVAPTTSTESSETADASASGQEGAVPSGAITIAGSEFKYEPAAISAKVGEPVTVVYENVGQYPHNFVVDELGVMSQTIKAGETGTFTFTPSKAGTFAFYCSLPNHRERGMAGVITVE